MHVTRTRRRILTTAFAVALTLGGLTACSSDGGTRSVTAEPTPPPEIANLLSSSLTFINSAKTARFEVAGTGVPKDAGKSRMVDGEGVMSRPTPTTAAFDGDLTVLVNGETRPVSVVSVRGQLYVRTGVDAKFQVSDPTSYGMIDPATWIKAQTGISRLLTDLKGIQDGGTSTLADGTVVHNVKGYVTGLLAARLMPIADVYSNVDITLAIDPKTAQLREAHLAGHFFDSAPRTSYVVELFDYGTKVDIKPPKM